MILAKFWILILLVIICIYDIRHLVIPDVCVLLMLPAALASSEGWEVRMAAALIVWTAFLLIAAVSALLKNQSPIGMGDIKLFSAIALISGPRGLSASLLVSSLTGGTFSAILLVLRKVQKKDQIAFGPFIAIGYAVYLASTSAM